MTRTPCIEPNAPFQTAASRPPPWRTSGIPTSRLSHPLGGVVTATSRIAPFALALGLVAAACSTSTSSTPDSSPSAPTAGTGGQSGAPPAFAAELEPVIAQKLKDN